MPIFPGASMRSVPPPRGIAFVWNEAVRLIDGQLRQAADLDSKASTLIGLTTAILALVVAQERVSAEGRLIFALELSVVLVFLVRSFALRSLWTAPALSQIVTWTYALEDEIRYVFLASMVEAYEANQATLLAKALYLRTALYAMLAFALTTLLFALWAS